MENKSIKFIISIVKPIGLGQFSLSPVLLSINDNDLIGKLFGFIKVREIPLKKIKFIKQYKRKRANLAYFWNAIELVYEKKDKTIIEYISASDNTIDRLINLFLSAGIKEEKS